MMENLIEVRCDKGEKTYKIKYEDGDMAVVTEGEIEKRIVPSRNSMQCN